MGAIDLAERSISTIRLWTEEEFLAAEVEWQSLLARSDADPLFMSWIWQSCWWRHHAKLLGSRLAIYAAYSCDGRLIGIAPFHIHKVKYRHFFSGTRVELLGSTFRNHIGMFSEYLDFIVDRQYSDVFHDALKDVLHRDGLWTDLVISNASKDGIAARFAREKLADFSYLRETDNVVAHVTKFPSEFSEYLKALPPTVRRKLWNHRSKLAAPKLVPVTKSGINEFCARLSVFHRQRWGFNRHEELRTAFYVDIADHLAERGTLRMSYLVNNGDPISLMFNIRIGDMEYNVQSGFDFNALPHASPGYLHFGFAMEDAHAHGVKRFNFLAGTGRSRDYKHDFLTVEEPLVTFQAIRGRSLAWLYRSYDRRFFSMVGGCLPCIGTLMDVPLTDFGFAWV